jgi:hypothetical protein
VNRVPFHLHTTAHAFAQLVSELTQFAHLRKFVPRFPTRQAGYFSLQPIRLPRKEDTGQHPLTLNMMCSFSVTGKPASTDYPAFWAIRFKVVAPESNLVKVTAECCHQPVSGYFYHLLKSIGWPLPGSPRAQGVLVTACPAKSQVRESDVRQTTRPFPFDRREICRQLRALCDCDAQFLALEHDAGPHDSQLAILDAEAIRRACTARQAAIGTAHLLPSENGVAIRFAPERSFWDETHPDKGKLLFRNFIWRANKHFDELAHVPSQVSTISGEHVKDGGTEGDLNASSNPNELQKRSEIALRRERVQKLYRRGLDIHVIANMVGYSESTIKRDLRAPGAMEK